jgi:tetratricopeptide (TPR) repeat protein
LAAAESTPENEWLLARAYASADRADSALAVCERILKRDPADARVLYFYTYLLFDRGRYPEAYASAQKLVKINPEISAHVFMEGSAAVELRKSDARKTLEKAVALAPLAPDYRARLAYADYVFGKSPKDRLSYRVTDSLKAEQAMLLEGFAQGQLARVLDPREVWERPAIYTDSAAARRHRLQAIERFEKFLTLDSIQAGAAGKRAAQFELASHLERLGDRGRAQDLLRALILQDSTNAMALNYLGYMLVEKLPVDTLELAEAGRLLDRALALEPENGAYLDSKGWYLYRTGALDSARIYLESASQTILSDPAILGHLAEVLQAQNRNEEACAILQELRRKYPKESKDPARALPAACKTP